MKFLILLLMIQSVWAQVFVTDSSSTELHFSGTLLTQGKSQRGSIVVRESQGNQHILIVNEVKDFRFPTQFEEIEFNDEFMESQYFPQIRISGKLKENINLLQDGIYIVHFLASFTMRYHTVEMEIPVRIEISGKKMSFQLRQKIDLVNFYVPYAGAGSDIGRFADYLFSAELKRTH